MAKIDSEGDGEGAGAREGISFEVIGEPASKANSRRLVLRHGNVVPIKSQKALNYVEAFLSQCPELVVPLQLAVKVEIRIWYASHRPDLDESVILDAMQKRIYENDRQVKEKVISWDYDPERPRSVITVTELPDHPWNSRGKKPGKRRKK